MRLLRGEGETRYVGFKQKGFSSATLCEWCALLSSVLVSGSS